MYNTFEKSQLNIKLLNNVYFNFYKSINLNINLYKLQTINDSTLIESLFLLEFFTGSKPFINYYKKNFKEINIQVMNHLYNKNLIYFFSLLKIFYLPILYRRNVVISKEKVSLSHFYFTINNVNILTFMPDLFFKWKIPVNCFFNLNVINKKEILLYLYYIGFNFVNSVKLLKKK